MSKFIYILLYPFYLIYLFIVIIRNILYNKKILPVTKLNCKIISIGNVSMGGTGKTPIVIELAKTLQQKYNVAILSRGYGRRTKGMRLVTDGKTIATNWKDVGDEPALMTKKLSGVPIVVDESRIRGGKYLVNNYNPDILILDDAFQHQRIHRDVDIVLINTNKPDSFTFLREPWASLKRAHLIFLTKSADTQKIASFKNRISRFDLPIFVSKQKVGQFLINSDGERIQLKADQIKDVLIFSGIADPKSFENTIKNLGFKVEKQLLFKDHYQYTNADMEKLEYIYKNSNADMILTTEKDLVKLPKSNLPIHAVSVSLTIQPEALNLIEKVLAEN